MKNGKRYCTNNQLRPTSETTWRSKCEQSNEGRFLDIDWHVLFGHRFGDGRHYSYVVPKSLNSSCQKVAGKDLVSI